jgi:hypothetical protein
LALSEDNSRFPGREAPASRPERGSSASGCAAQAVVARRVRAWSKRAERGPGVTDAGGGLPAGLMPIIVADAGFRVPFYRAVERHGWRWVGRVRGRDLVRVGKRWASCRTVFRLGSEKWRYTRPHDTPGSI